MSSNNKRVVQKIVLAGVVCLDNKVLILQRNKDEEVFPNLWELPSGKREPLEDSTNSLIREVKEETGLDVAIKTPISTFDYQIEKPDEIRDTVQINYLVNVTGGSVKISSEHQAYKWLEKDEIENYELSNQTKKVIINAFKYIN